MTIPELIEEILNEWAYRVDDGMPDIKNKQHIKVLDEVLSDVGLSEVKHLIVETLEEADKTFSNPALNKKVTYKNAKGEDKEGIVGNLLRQPKGSPGREAAERMLPPEGSPERDEINKDLGGEGQPTKPEDEKGKEGGDAKGGEEEKAKAAQAMFDPKADPAMADRMDTEKDTLAKIAGEKEKEKQRAKETDSVDKQDASLVNYINKDFNEAPDKDFEGMSDDEVQSKELEARNNFTDIMKEKGEDSPEAKAAKADWAKHMTEKSKRRGDMENAAMWDSIRQDNDPSYKPAGPGAGPGGLPPTNEPARPDATPPTDTQKDAPKPPAELQPANDDPNSKAKKFKGETSGKEIQTISMEGGGQVYGTVHRDTKMVDDIVNQVKNSIPKEKWKDVVFVGEGGATGENGELEFHDEMVHATEKFKEMGAGVDTFDGDELDVHNDQSKLYQKQKEKTGLNDSQVKAGNWASMIGQGEGTDTMSPNDFLDDEGKQFLQDAAKEAGFPEIENWDEPTEQDKDTLYRLSFPEDNGDKKTKINDIQVAFNDIRDENIIEKNKQLTAQGKIPITIAGEGHIDLVDKMMQKSEQPAKAEPEKPSEPTKVEPEKPADKKDFSKEEPGQEATSSSGKRIYSIGGGYYSDKKGGPAKYVRTESIIDMAFEDIITEDVFALFEKTITATLANGETIKVQELPPRAQKKATDKAKAAAAQTSAEQPKSTEQPKAADKPESEFKPIPSQDVQKEIPKANPETFGGESDIPDGIDKKDLNKFNTDIQKVKQIVDDAKAKGEKAPNINLCQITVPGTNLYCDNNLGIPRAEMPQFKGKAIEGSKAAGMPVDKDGEVDTEPVFREMLKQKGIAVSQTEVPADKLKATQSELVGAKVVGMMGALEENPNHEKITAPIYVSRDGYVIDGHHRWAAIAAYNAANPDKQIPMKVQVIDQDIKDAIPMCNQFAEDIGIAAKKADANKETPSQKPAEQPTTTQPQQKGTKPTPQTATKPTKGKTPKTGGTSAKSDIPGMDTDAFGGYSSGLSSDEDRGKEALNQIKDKVKDWSEKEKNFFKEKVHKGNSPERRSWGKAIKDKAKGAIAAIKKGFKHEVEEFKAAGHGLKNFFSGKPVSKHEQKALKAVAFKVVTTALFGAAFGGLAHGAGAFAKHVAVEFIPHVIGETILKGAGSAAIFAGPEEENTDLLLEKFANIIAEKMASEEIPAELMVKMIDSYNAKKEIKKEMKIESLIKQIISEIVTEAPATQGGDWRLAARKGGPDGKIVYFGTKEKKQAALQSGSHVDVDKNLNAVGAKDAKAKPAKSVAMDKDLQARVDKEKATLNKIKGNQPAQAPVKLSSKMEEDDVFFSKKSVESKATEADAKIDKLPIKDKEKLVIKGVIRKVLKGQDLTKDEIKVASDWITFPATSDAKIYFASEAGNFKDHDKITISTSMSEEARAQFNEFLENNEVFDAGHPVKKKSMVASKLTPKRTFTKVANIKKDKEGNVSSVTVGNTTLDRIPVPVEKELVTQFKKQGIQNPEQEAKNAVVAIERHNAMINFLASQKDIETIDFGHDTNSSEGRRDTIESIKGMMGKKLLEDFTKYYKGKANIPKEAKNVLNLINNLSNPYINPSGNAAEKLQQEIDAIAILMNNNPDFRAGVPDMQEIFDFVVKLGEGYSGFMPSASNWKVTDIVTYKPTQSFKFKKGESPAEAIARNLQTFKSTVLIEGGSSVKYEKGGASAGLDKVLMTVYNKHKGFDTQKELVKMFDIYKWSFTPGEQQRVKSEQEIRAKDAELNDTLNRAVNAGIITPAEKNEILAEGVKQATSMANKVEKKIPFEKYKQCFGKTASEQKKNYQNYKTQLGLWCKMGAIAEVINNNDARYQLFGNLRTRYPKKGAPKHEVIDGVNVLSGMGWSYDPGIAATGKECKYISMNNANSSHIEPIQRKG